MSPVERRRPDSQSPIRPKVTRQPEAIVAAPQQAPSVGTAGAMAPERQSATTPVRRWSVRVYSTEEAAACDRLRLQLGQGLGWMPSLSEISKAAAVLAAGDATARAALEETLRRIGPTRATQR